MVEVKEVETIMKCIGINIKNKFPKDKKIAVFPNEIIFGDGMYKYKLFGNAHSMKKIWREIKKSKKYLNQRAMNEDKIFLLEKGMKKLSEIMQEKMLKFSLGVEPNEVIQNYAVVQIDFFHYTYFISIDCNRRKIEIHSSG